MQPAFLRCTRLSKRFGSVAALENVDLELSRGEVVAIVGDNGAGKSTLIKLLSGAYAPSSGSIVLNGREVAFRSPLDAQAEAIATIYQELALAENLTVYENIYLGHELCQNVFGIPLLSRGRMRAKSRKLLEELEAHVPDVGILVGRLSGGQRQAVAIARALMLDARLVIMDEPTAALAVAETRKVLGLIGRLRAGGHAVLIVSHNMLDVFEVADRIIVFRRGRKIAERPRGDTDLEEIVALITGAHESVRAREALERAGCNSP